MNLYLLQGLRLLASTFPFFAMSIVYIFCYWLPKKHCASKQRAFEQNIRIGQEVSTKSGIIGTVVEKTETTLTIKSDSSLLKIRRSSLKANSENNE